MVVDLFPAVGEKADEVVADGVAGLGGLGIFQKPLLREAGFNRHIGALAETNIVFVRFLFHEKAEFRELGHGLGAGFEPVETSEFLAGQFVQGRVGVENVDDGEVVAEADLVVGLVMCGGDFKDAGAEFEIDRLVTDDREERFDIGGEGAADMEADELGVAGILGVNGHGGVGHDRFGTGGGDLEKGPGFFHHLDAVVVEKGFLGFWDDFLVTERGEGDGAPVHHALASIDHPLGVEINENLLDLARVGVVHREAFPGPIAGAAEFFELVDDDAAVLVLPLPDALEELVAAEVVAGFLFLFAELALDDGLRGDAGVVGAREPEDLVAGLAGVAGEDVLECVVQHMAEREDAGDIRRRDNDRVSGLRRGGVGGEVAVLDPPGIPLFFDGLGLVGLGQFRHGAGFNRVHPRRESGK